MRPILAAMIAVLCIGAPTAMAQPRGGPDEPPRQQERPRGERPAPDFAGPSPDGPRYSRGDRLPTDYRQDRYRVSDWRTRNLTPPPRGYQWYCYRRGDCFLVRTNTGAIRETRWRDDRDFTWRQRYSLTYDYRDDVYYRECRERPDPAGIILGGLIGGLIGQAIGRDGDDAGAIFAGVIIGGALGGALARDLDCDDRSYAYAVYHRALNDGRVGVVHRWRNPQNAHRGDFTVRSYYYDPAGFRCANVRHVVYVDRRRQADGRACRQPDGAWVFLD